MPDNDINNLLEKFRYDGKRFWFRDPDGRWHTTSSSSIKLFLVVERNMPSAKAAQMRDALKAASRNVDDPDWNEQVRWLNFTKGRHLYVWLGTVEFCDPYSGRSKRSMKIAAFNEKVSEEFPSRPTVPEDSPIGFLGV